MPNTEQLKKNFNFVSENIENKILSAYAIGFGGIERSYFKMAFGNEIGVDINLNEADLFNYNYGSILVKARKNWTMQTLNLSHDNS